jgi:dolichol-phosphate mannosyltransferase
MTSNNDESARNERFIVVVPAYDEAATIREVIERASRYCDVCIVDDCSTDGTARIVRETGKAHLIQHERNTHIAGAILDGFRHAIEAGYTHCITMDAGLSHDPDAIPSFKEKSCADLVIGYRAERVDVPLYRRALSWGAAYLMNLALPPRFVPWGGAGLKDVTSGYRMYSRRAIELLVGANMRCCAFDFHIEALAYVYRAKMEITEVPIRYEFSNSSLRPEIVREALRTCGWIWRNELS